MLPCLHVAFLFPQKEFQYQRKSCGAKEVSQRRKLFDGAGERLMGWIMARIKMQMQRSARPIYPKKTQQKILLPRKSSVIILLRQPLRMTFERAAREGFRFYAFHLNLDRKKHEPSTFPSFLGSTEIHHQKNLPNINMNYMLDFHKCITH